MAALVTGADFLYIRSGWEQSGGLVTLKKHWVGILSSAVLAATLSAAPVGGASAAAPDPAVVGTSAATAGGSCWEIKQARAGATDGVYWLLTPKMSQPEQFYCDMTSDGGGWVLVGKGRDAWTNDQQGKGSPAQLLSPSTVPMTADTHQLPSDKVDELLNGGRVDALSEGVRLRRATNGAGTSWQEVRINFADRSRWAWTFGAEWPLAGYSFDGTSRSGGTSPTFGIDNAFRRVNNTSSSAMGWRTGFAYGSQVSGSSSSSTYLYSESNGAGSALPYTQVYLRPRVTSSDAGFAAIGNGGTAALPQPAVARSTALASPWGVTGTAGDSSLEGSVEVQAFTQSGNRMYVGGNFRYVQRDESGTGRVEQPYLAAFDIGTGEWVSSFRPVLNEQVRALTTLPNGQVVAGGDFTMANGQQAGVVALDPDTGASSTSWNVSVENRLTNGDLRIRALQTAGPYVYIGGALTHTAGGTRTTPVYMRSLARVSSVDGTPSTGWNPNLNGTVIDVDASDDLSRVYAAGYFTQSNGQAAKNAAAILNVAGAPLATPSWAPVWSANKSYQQAIEAVGSKVWVGGSEHNLFQYSDSTFQRLNGEILKQHGDIQATTADHGVLYAGCHCNQFSYSNAFTWPNLGSGWTQADAIGWFGAWNADTGKRIPQFVPTFNMRLDQGIFALQADSNGTVWAGGDIVTVRTNAQQARWSGGFARFPLADSTPPPTPSNFRVVGQDSTSVTLAWDTVTDASFGVSYQVLRDDRTLATTSGSSITVPRGGNNRFFLRAVDGPGNVSASTGVLSVGALQPPVASFTVAVNDLVGSFDASASNDPDGSIVSYSWDFGDGGSAAGRTAGHTYAGPGSYTVRLTVTDNDGATATTTRQANVTAALVTSVVVAEGSSWRWRYEQGAPPAGWNTVGFNASSWNQGNAVLGFGGPVATDLDTFASTSDRPLAAYFTRTFQVSDASKVTRLVLDSRADDGAVIYVNGTEVGRQNMPAGPVGQGTYASSARRTSAALQDPLVVEVPTALLVDGTNVVSAETHLNYRNTRDMTFEMKATITQQQ